MLANNRTKMDEINKYDMYNDYFSTGDFDAVSCAAEELDKYVDNASRIPLK